MLGIAALYSSTFYVQLFYSKIQSLRLNHFSVCWVHTSNQFLSSKYSFVLDRERASEPCLIGVYFTFSRHTRLASYGALCVSFQIADFVGHYFWVDNYGTRWVTIFTLIYFCQATIVNLMIAINVRRLLYRALQTYNHVYKIHITTECFSEGFYLGCSLCLNIMYGKQRIHNKTLRKIN